MTTLKNFDCVGTSCSFGDNMLSLSVDLTIHISGAADSATGTSVINRQLSKERAKYIGKLLIKRGIDKEKLKAFSFGGICQFTPKQANRFAVLLLSE